MRFWTGGYTDDGKGAATGVGTLVAGGPHDALAGGPLGFAGDAVATGGSPSWITAHPSLEVVYAALEGDGAVRAFRRTGEASLDPLGEPVAAGELTCHVAVAPDGASLIASCWGDGRVVRMALDAAGRPSAPVAAPAAADPYAGGGDDSERGVAFSGARPADVDLAAAARAVREAAGAEYAHLVPDVDTDGPDAAEPAGEPASRVSRAHQAAFLPGGVIATTDMGLDLVRFWRVGPGGMVERQQVVLPKGSGPRHTVWHPSGHLYVLTELSHEVFVLAPHPSQGAGGAWSIIGATPLGVGVQPDDTAAELCSSHDGNFLYAGVRGSNTIATLRVQGDGSAVAPVALVEAGVNWPRHHVVVRDTLLVAGQRSNEVASLTLDLRTGVPGKGRHRTAVPTPTCLLPVR